MEGAGDERSSAGLGLIGGEYEVAGVLADGPLSLLMRAPFPQVAGAVPPLVLDRHVGAGGEDAPVGAEWHHMYRSGSIQRQDPGKNPLLDWRARKELSRDQRRVGDGSSARCSGIHTPGVVLRR